MDLLQNTFATLFVSALGGGFALLGNYLIVRRQDRDGRARSVLSTQVEVHQQAYAHWFRLRHLDSPGEDRLVIVNDALDWWSRHCLYLPPALQDSFYSTVIAARQHADTEGDRRNVFWDELKILGVSIEASVRELGIHLDTRSIASIR
ncbi:MAG: hypothetical protein JNK74_15120 [Candidatus Hydrogenedentes bacterium]|nr:hypothetical protein [Candidatus Hydrogenedentota bacterium]